MKKSNLFYIILIVIGAILSAQSIFILDETQQAIVTQFGKPIGEPRTSPGVNFVVPFRDLLSQG